jgi:hypothetical protein
MIPGKLAKVNIPFLVYVVVMGADRGIRGRYLNSRL